MLVIHGSRTRSQHGDGVAAGGVGGVTGGDGPATRVVRGPQEHNHPASSAAAQAAPGPTGHYSKWAWLCLAFENT